MALTNEDAVRLGFRRATRRLTGTPRVLESLDASPAPSRVFRLSYFTLVHRAVAEVEAGLRDSVDTWLPIAAYTAHRTGLFLLSQVGVNLFGRQKFRMVDVELTEATHSVDGSTVFGFSWLTRSTKAPFLIGRVEIAALNPKHTLMSLNATYQPTAEVASRLPDEALTCRIGQATLRDFTERMARRLEQESDPT